MAKIEWTPAQKNAIDARDGTVLVSAAAGSGKTAVLVNRVIEMITDDKNPCSVDELLIVTFTKAAAAQMKDKINKTLTELIKEETTIKRKSYLIRQQMLLKCARVSTIDSFCSEIVKQNIQAVPLDSNYRLLDENAMNIIKDEAYEEVAEEFYSTGDKTFLLLADMFTKSNDDKLLKELVFSLYDFASSYKNPKKWIEDIDKKFRNDKTDMTNPYAVTLVKNLRNDILYCRTLADKAYEIASEDEITFNSYKETILSDIRLFDSLLEKIPEDFTEENWDEAIEFIVSTPFVRLGNLKRGYTSEEADAVKIIRSEYKDCYAKSVDTMQVSSKDNKRDVEILSPVMQKLSEFTLAFFDRFKVLKIERNCADFNDVLHMALELLIYEENGEIRKTELAENYSEEFRQILIDEYQDTNEAQDILFNAISKDGNNLFFVGDVKQSIYGFRKAMPAIFLKKRKEFAEFDEKNPVYPATISLDMNFRSDRDVTEFVNFIFTQLMSEGAGEIEYNERESLKANKGYSTGDEVSCSVHVIDKSVLEETEAPLAEALHIGGEIKRLKEKGLYDFRDIAILVRTNKNIPLFVQTLNDMGINAHADESTNLFETEEVRTVMSLVKVIDNPVRDIPLLAVMMSPIFAFSADELSQIRIETKSGSFYHAVKTSAENGNERCKTFLESLNSFRLVSQTVTPGELIRHILSETGYKSIVLSMDRGQRRQENLDILKSFADEFSAENDVGLSGFVRQVEKMEASSSIKGASVSSGNENSVAVMTIHRSKGLEFPVCFIAETEQRFSTRSLFNDLLAHPQSGVGIVGIDTDRMIKYETLSRTAIKLDKIFTELSENMRVLYVAMTRAMEKLIIVGAPSDYDKLMKKAAVIAFGEKINPVAVKMATSYLEWITAAAIRHPDNVWMRVRAGALCHEKLKTDFNLDVRVIKELPVIQEAEEAENPSQEIDEEYYEEVKGKTAFVYPYSHLSGVLAKRGASTAFKETVDREFFASDRPAFMNKTSLTAAGRGTAMHLFMQFSDYKSGKNDIEKEISRLLDAGFLTDIQAESLDRKKLTNFFSSPLYERIAASEKVYREKKFIIGMAPSVFDESLEGIHDEERVIVQGILDCAFEEDGEIVIVDYKTDKVSSPEVLRERYSGQLEIYEQAVKECLGKNVKETLLYSFSLETTVKI